MPAGVPAGAGAASYSCPAARTFHRWGTEHDNDYIHDEWKNTENA